jgi:hypothetical protein
MPARRYKRPARDWAAAEAEANNCRVLSPVYDFSFGSKADQLGCAIECPLRIEADQSLRANVSPPWAEAVIAQSFFLVSAFATSRARSMKSSATGLNFRIFSLTMSVGRRDFGSSIGRLLISDWLVGNFNADTGRIVRKQPMVHRAGTLSGYFEAISRQGLLD